MNDFKKHFGAVKLYFALLITFSIYSNALAQIDVTQKHKSYDSLPDANLSETQLADFKDKALRKTKALSGYIAIVADKKQSEIQRNRAIEEGIKLFRSESNIVEVSVLNSPNPPSRYPIRNYFIKLKKLPYAKTTITWFDLYFSTFVKRADGRYEGVATIFQRFDGVMKEGWVYKDITQKKIQIILSLKTIKTGDEEKLEWEVVLGDIEVVGTKAAPEK